MTTIAGIDRQSGSPRREQVALGVLVGGLGAALAVRSAVPRRWHLPYNVAIGACSVAVARAGGLGATELGLGREHAGAGARWGAAAFGGITLAAAVGALAGLLEDDRTDVTADEMLWQVGIAIPLGTIAVEELAFRGALHGLLERVVTPGTAWAAGAVLFGLWHVPGAWDDGPAGVAVTLVATSVAGAGLVWLRRRSGSLLAPALAHLATNASSFFLSWLAGP